MESILANYIPKQQKLLSELDSVISQVGIKLEIDPAEYIIQSPCSLDVEHDEQGNMVCIGIYDGVKAYCFTKVTPKLREILES